MGVSVRLVIGKISVMGKNPMSSPKLPRKRMRIFKANRTRRRFANMGDEVLA
jgi:hypothetical protein